MSKSVICFLSVAIVIGFGMAMQPVFSETPGGQEGAKLYEEHCGACHPGGKTPMAPDQPVVGSPYMKSPDAFAKFNRDPHKPDGTKGAMPAFPKDKISDDDMKKIYEYARSAFKG